MKLQIPIHPFVRVIVRRLKINRSASVAPPEQLDLGLDRITETGLPLRDAMRVRSAEFWLALREPRLALREFDALTEAARQNDWAVRTHFAAQRETTTSNL